MCDIKRKCIWFKDYRRQKNYYFFDFELQIYIQRKKESVNLFSLIEVGETGMLVCSFTVLLLLCLNIFFNLSNSVYYFLNDPQLAIWFYNWLTTFELKSLFIINTCTELCFIWKIFIRGFSQTKLLIRNKNLRAFWSCVN